MATVSIGRPITPLRQRMRDLVEIVCRERLADLRADLDLRD